MRVLSGVQPSGKLHVGNWFGAIRQFLHLQQTEGTECYYFIADLHAMTSVQNGDELRANSLMLATDFVALGLDPQHSVLYRQSDVPEVTELTWMLSSVTSMGLLQRSTSFKDKTSRGLAASHALFSYPVLMAADILIVRADRVPVGKDQKQHLEITRDVATAFNQAYGEVLTLPEPMILADVAVVPGLDGKKMSKSYGNTLEIFAPENELKKRIMSMATDSTPVAEPKPTKDSALYDLLKLFTPASEWGETKRKFTEGGTGYGELKKLLLGRMLDTFSIARLRREKLANDQAYVKQILVQGRERAREVIGRVMSDCRAACGLGWR